MGILDAPGLPRDVSVAPTDGQTLIYSTYLGKYRPGRRPSVIPTPPVYQVFPAVMANPPTTAFTSPGGSNPITSSTALPHDTTLISRRGMVPQLLVGGSNNFQTNSLNAAWTPPVYTIEFEHYGDDVALRFRNRSTNSARVWTWVDDLPATAAPELLTAGASNSYAYYRLTFGSVALRRIRLVISVADFGGLIYKTVHSVLPVQRVTPKLLMYGDSYVGSTGADYEATGLAYRVGQMLAWEVFAAGQGGTGYGNDAGGGSKGAYGDSTRIAAAVAAAPDYIVIWGSPNDDAVSSSTVGANAATLYAAFASALPQARVLVIGPPRTSGSPPAGRTANRDAIATAAAAAKNVIGFVDPIAGAWTTGTGKVGSTTGDGNADLLIGSDGVHPTQPGHDLFARLTASALLAAVA